jgi:HK97 family phage prohead protease
MTTPPLLERGRITTLSGSGLELAALATGLAISYRNGQNLVPGWPSLGPGGVDFEAYAETWVFWRTLVAEICELAEIPNPAIDLRCCDEVWRPAKVVDPDPDAGPFWDTALETDVEADVAAATVQRRQLAPFLQVICGIRSAAGFSDEARQQFYERLRGQTVLAVDVGSAWGGAASYGPVVDASDLYDSVGGLRELIERIVARVPHEDVGADAISTPEPPSSTNGAHRMHRGGDVNDLLEECGVDAVRQLVTDGRSAASTQLKALARSRGLGPGALWKAAQRFADEAIRSSALATRVAGRGPGTLFGFAARFNEWREVDDVRDGHFMERFAPGAFSRGIAEQRQQMKVTFRHGKDPRFGHRSLGPILTLEERPEGLFYECELLDADHCWELAPWLATGKYGGSLTFRVMRDTFVVRPDKSEYNPGGIPERTVTEIRVQEFGPVWPPAYRGTSAGVLPRRGMARLKR